jgi:hypothetical protein
LLALQQCSLKGSATGENMFVTAVKDLNVSRIPKNPIFIPTGWSPDPIFHEFLHP